MDHADHVRLIRAGVAGAESGTWADIGSGTGAFTLALADLLGPEASIVSVDRDPEALRRQEERMRMAFPTTRLRTLTADFTAEIALPALDGLVMANALHFVARQGQAAVVAAFGRHLRPRGRFVLVEYDADDGNQWVPYPLSYRTWDRLGASCGLLRTRRIGRVPSRFLGAIYAAVSEAPP